MFNFFAAKTGYTTAGQVATHYHPPRGAAVRAMRRLASGRPGRGRLLLTYVKDPVKLPHLLLGIPEELPLQTLRRLVIRVVFQRLLHNPFQILTADLYLLTHRRLPFR